MDMIAAVEDLQIDVNSLDEKLERVSQDLQEINGTLRNHRSLNAHLESEIAKLKREITTCIDVKLLYSDRQARESWQNGCDEIISSIIQRIADMDLMFKQAFIYVDNSHVNDAAKYYGLAPIDQLNKIAKEVPHHPSRKHLEKKLHEKNELITELKQSIEYLNKVLGESRNESQENLNKANTMIDCLHRKQGEINQLTDTIQNQQSQIMYLNEHKNCKRICCLPQRSDECQL